MFKPVRIAAAAAGLAAALALTGCGSGDSGGDEGKTPASPTASAEAGGEAQQPEDVEGTWAGVTDSKPVVLSVKNGKAALLADGHACTGAVEDHDGSPMLSLKCADGNTDRTMGAIESNDGTTLVVSWDAGAKDTLKKSDGATLPDGLPTELPAS